MKTITKRGFSALLVLVILVSLFSGMTISASAASYTYNTGTRHEVCPSLSSQAQAYYTGDYTYEALSALSGGTASTDADAMNHSAMSSALYQQMQTLMTQTHTTSISYGSLTEYWKYTDASGGAAGTILFYSDQVSSSYNREHVWPKSRGSFYQTYAGSDLHHLRPTNANVNSTRGNMTMGNVRNVISGYKTYQYNGSDVLYYSTADDLVEVNDNIKGDVARIMLYVWCRWGEPNLFVDDASLGVGPGDDANNGLKVMESVDTLLQWCQMDPVDTWEMSRNDQTQNVQGNRNIFIDYPELAWLVLGQQLPSNMQTPSGNAMNSGASFTIHAVSNNTAFGTVSVSGRVITATPAEGYYASGYEVTSGSAAVTRNGNLFTVNASSDCTVKIVFSAKTLVTVNFSVPDGVSQAAVSGYAGEAITLPTPTGTPNDTTYNYRFLGWYDSSLAATPEKPENYYAAGSSFTPTASTTLYALYSYAVAEEGGSATTFNLFTGSEMVNGNYIIVDDNTGSAMSSTVESNWIRPAFEVYDSTVETIEAPVESIVWNITDGVITTADSSISGDTALYSSGAKAIAYGASGTEWTFTVSGGIWTIASGSNILSLNGSNGWRPYRGGYGSNKTFRLYHQSGIGSTTYYTTQINSCTHVWDTLEIKAPTCTEEGYTIYVCKNCGLLFNSDIVAATGHTEAVDEAVPATCTENGLTEGTHCAVCGEIITAQEVIPATGHSYGYTDNGDGTHAVTCASCGDSYNEAHTFTDGTCICGALEVTGPTVDTALTLNINTSALALEGATLLRICVPTTAFSAYDIDTAYMEVVATRYNTATGEYYTVTTNIPCSGNYGKNYYKFDVENIPAAQLNDELTMTIHVNDADGKEYVGEAITYSAAARAHKYVEDAKGAALEKTMINLLRYAGAFQSYFGYNTANLASARITAADNEAYPATEVVLPTDSPATITLDGATVTNSQKSLNIDGIVGIANSFKLPSGADVNEYRLNVSYNDKSVDIAGSEWVYRNTTYGYNTVFDQFAAAQMRVRALFAVYQGDAQVSDAFYFSIADYVATAHTAAANGNANAQKLLPAFDAMLNYGDAAAAYFGTN